MNYHAHEFKSYRETDKGDREMMANFVATITQETRYTDGMNAKTMLTIAGQIANPDPDKADEPIDLEPVEVSTDDFPGFAWVVPNWGTRCVIRPGSGMKDDLRAMIQLHSSPALKTVFKATGWQMVGNRRMFVHNGGAIGKAGNDPAITVRLPHELSRYNLAAAAEPKAAVGASLALLDLARHDLTWPLLLCTLAPLYGDCDFATHVTGRTGSFKSELLSLFQSHYGPEMDARHLPGSWSSTPNAIEALAFYAKNCPFVLDDFVPAGTSWQQRSYQQNADKIIRAQGNQAGRARLSDTSTLQQTMFPRGLIMSTGEDTPEGHSVRGRLLIHEIAAGEIDPDNLTEAQRMRPLFSGTVAWLAQVLAGQPHDWKTRAAEFRPTYRGLGHARTPDMLAKLHAVAEHFLAAAAAAGILSAADMRSYYTDAVKSLRAAGEKQASVLESHVRTIRGGTPVAAELLGWTVERHGDELAAFKSRGPTIGWVKRDSDELFLDVTQGYALIRKVAGPDLSLTKQTLFKRFKDAGVLTRVDEARNRNTVRIQAENHPRQVIAVSLVAALDLKEFPNDDAPAAAADPDAAAGDDYADEAA
jgi:hypothetical protein